MKLPATLFCLILSSWCFAQNGNPAIHQNELIYSEKTIDILTELVDSLHASYPEANLGLRYKAIEQARGYYIEMFGPACMKATEDLKAGITLKKFRKRYPEAEISSLKIIARTEHKNYDGDQVVSFSGIPSDSPFGTEIEFDEDIEQYQGELRSKWSGYYYSYDSYNSESEEMETEYRLLGYYLDTPFEDFSIPESYNNHIDYADYVIDTATTIYRDSASRFDSWYNEISGQSNPAIGACMNYIHTSIHNPRLDSTSDYWQYKRWYQVRIQLLKDSFSNDPQLKQLLGDAVNEVVKNDFKYRDSDDPLDELFLGKTYNREEFEEYVEYFFAPEIALEIKRNRMVYGECSQDEAPVLHLIDIARLAAKSGNWNVFFKAHMAVLNDNVHRVVDSSFGMARRKTYLKEIEAIGVRVSDLVLGISLRISNSSPNHYFGDVGRLGKALSESEDKSAVEKVLIAAISDQDLDEYNRVLLYYLFLNYVDHLKESPRYDHAKELAEKAKMTFPKALREGLD